MLTHIQAEIVQPLFWLSLGKIVWIDVLLSGDNALVIAMVCRGLAPKQRLWGMILGAAGAVLMRVTITATAGEMMGLPYVKAIGGGALLIIAIKLLAPPDDDESEHKQASTLLAAIGMVMMADITMSIDNIIAIAAAAKGDNFLLGLGLGFSIPLIVTGASIIVALLDRLPILVWAGAALLGWIAGEVIVADHVVSARLASPFDQPIFYAVGAACLVLIAGATWRQFSTHPLIARAS